MIAFFPPFDAPDACGELCPLIPGSRAVEWEPASSADVEDQEAAGLAPARRSVESWASTHIVAFMGTASLALTVAAQTPTVDRVLIFDPAPLPPDKGTSVFDPEAVRHLEEVMPQFEKIGGVDLLFDRLDQADEEGASQDVKAAILVEFYESSVLPSIDDPHEYRLLSSRLSIIRRDGPLGSGQRVLPVWHASLQDPRLRKITSIIVTSAVGAFVLNRLEQHGVASARAVPMRNAWWWAQPQEGAALITRWLLSGGG